MSPDASGTAGNLAHFWRLDKRIREPDEGAKPAKLARALGFWRKVG
jgi:hypothetical protein